MKIKIERQYNWTSHHYDEYYMGIVKNVYPKQEVFGVTLYGKDKSESVYSFVREISAFNTLDEAVKRIKDEVEEVLNSKLISSEEIDFDINIDKTVKEEKIMFKYLEKSYQFLDFTLFSKFIAENKDKTLLLDK